METVDGFPVAYVRFTERLEVLSSAVLNGGDSVAGALFIMQVGKDYDRPDPREHAASVRDALGLPEDTVGMMTAAEVGSVFNVAVGEYDGTEVEAVATAGLSNHVVAGEVLENYPERRLVSDRRARDLAGTINIAVISPVPLTMAGKVNMMIPLVEAKSASMADRGYRETGTTSDAMAVLSPIGDDRRDYSGTGSDLGIAAARAELVSLSGSGLDADSFMPRLAEALSSPEVRSLLDLAMHCAARADSMADDGSPAERKLVFRLIGDVTGHVPDDSEDTVHAAVAAICRYAGD